MHADYEITMYQMLGYRYAGYQYRDRRVAMQTRGGFNEQLGYEIRLKQLRIGEGEKIEALGGMIRKDIVKCEALCPET